MTFEEKVDLLFFWSMMAWPIVLVSAFLSLFLLMYLDERQYQKSKQKEKEHD